MIAYLKRYVLTNHVSLGLGIQSFGNTLYLVSVIGIVVAFVFGVLSAIGTWRMEPLRIALMAASIPLLTFIIAGHCFWVSDWLRFGLASDKPWALHKKQLALWVCLWALALTGITCLVTNVIESRKAHLTPKVVPVLRMNVVPPL